MFERAAKAKADVLGSLHVPYVRHLDPETVVLAGGELLTIVEVDGLSFEAVDMDDINAHDRLLNALWLNIADDQTLIWSILLRRRVTDYPETQFDNAFVAKLDQRYRERLSRTELYSNRLFVAVLRAPAPNKPGLFGNVVQVAEDDAEFIAKHKDKVLGITTSLASVRARVLSLFEQDGVWFSEPATLLHWLVGGRMDRVPLVSGGLWSAVLQDRLVFKGETVEIWHPERTAYAAIFGLKEYPSTCTPTMLDQLLTAPFELTVVQSWWFLGKSDARDLLKLRAHRLKAANDGAAKQLPYLAHALDELQDNKFAFGSHQSSVTVFADSTKALSDNMAACRMLLVKGGSVVSREDMGLEGAWWAQLPGNAKYRARQGFITTRNFACLSPLHGYPKGQATGNHWGPSLTLLRTSSGAPFNMNLHVGELGNTLFTGPSGSGKTVAFNFMLAMSLKFKPRIVVMDKDRGCELFIRAVGGRYFNLRNGVPTGCAPLRALEISETTLGWFSRWIETLAGGAITPLERASIGVALNGLSRVPMAHRSFRNLLQLLDTRDPGGLAGRLSRWQKGQPLGWVFDGDADNIGLEAQVIGFDMTEVLDLPEIRGPLMDYLFYRCTALLNGQRVIFAIDEFWKALDDVGFQAFVQDQLQTIRKKNGLMIFATQSPRDALRSKIAHTIIEQCPTQIFFPNGRADPEDYRKGMKLGPREFALVSQILSPGSRKFLVKQEAASVVVELNLNGFDDELVILSGRTESVALLDVIRGEVGDDPARWMPLLFERWRNRNQTAA